MIYLLILVSTLLTGCLHELKLVPYCEGTPAKQFPCIGGCKVKVAAPVPTEQLLPNALVIKDHLGIIRCMEVAG